MSWNPLKKKHLTIRPTPAPPLISSKEDRELDILVQKLMQFDDTSKNLMKKVKQYYQEMLALNEADLYLSTQLSESNLVHINEELRSIVEDYHSVTHQVGRTIQSTKNLYLMTFVEPLKKFRDELIKVEADLAKREELVTQWRIAYTRLMKLQEKKDRIASHIAKLDIEGKFTDSLGKELKEFHENLIITLRSLIEKRIKIIKPCVNALMIMQLDYYGNMTKMFTDLMSTKDLTDSPNRNSTFDRESKCKITNEMARIKDLAIIKSMKM